MVFALYVQDQCELKEYSMKQTNMTPSGNVTVIVLIQQNRHTALPHSNYIWSLSLQYLSKLSMDQPSSNVTRFHVMSVIFIDVKVVCFSSPVHNLKHRPVGSADWWAVNTSSSEWSGPLTTEQEPAEELVFIHFNISQAECYQYSSIKLRTCCVDPLSVSRDRLFSWSLLSTVSSTVLYLCEKLSVRQWPNTAGSSGDTAQHSTDTSMSTPLVCLHTQTWPACWCVQQTMVNAELCGLGFIVCSVLCWFETHCYLLFYLLYWHSAG